MPGSGCTAIEPPGESRVGRWPGTARILLTGYADMNATVAAINEGHIYRYIHKPWDETELRLTVRAFHPDVRDLLQRDKPLTASELSGDSHSMHNFLHVDGDGRPDVAVGNKRGVFAFIQQRTP